MKNMKKEVIRLMLAGIIGGLISFGLIHFSNIGTSASSVVKSDHAQNYQMLTRTNLLTGESAPDFTAPAQLALPTVVHIKATSGEKETNKRDNDRIQPFFGFPDDFFDGFDFFRQPDIGRRNSSGSGVILTSDGYIVTNNHVVEGSDKLEVTLYDNRSFPATIIGTDPSTDLALLKIKANNLSFLKFGDSDKLQVGEWVLAVGNPFNLTSTVTAGIVSAKGRSLNIISDKFKVESFIQTDAAVNPGNSGGALINRAGELIGINTAIAGTRTGTFSGYSFAVPAAMVQKVVNDLMTYGQVQRAFLGISIQDVNAELAEKEKLQVNNGVFVGAVNEGGAAEAAGIKKGDVITKINEVTVTTAAQLQEQVARQRPGTQVNITIIRDGKEKIIPVTLKNKSGNTALVKREKSEEINSVLGAVFGKVDPAELEKLDLSYGVRVESLSSGKLKSAGIREGFIITKVDREPVRTPEELVAKLENKTGGVMFEGVYPNGTKAYYAIGL
jgi:Do/DeqQ family serine protease